MHVTCYPDGLEVVASANEAGLALESYRIRVSSNGPHHLRFERREPPASFRGIRFASFDELTEALRREIGKVGSP